MDEIKYLNDVVDLRNIRLDRLNLIILGVGTEKTYFSLNKCGLLQKVHDQLGIHIEPSQILVVTSRRMIVDQQVRTANLGDYLDGNRLEEIIYSNIGITIENNKIPVITYNRFYHLLNKQGLCEYERFIDNFKIIVFDEAHAIIKDRDFIKEMGKVQEFIVGKTLNKENKTYMIGMTATGELLKEYLNVPIYEVLDEPLHNYHVKNVHIGYPLDVYSLILKYGGKSLVMIDKISDAFELQSKIGSHAKVLISKGDERYTNEMDSVREYIIQNNTLPE